MLENLKELVRPAAWGGGGGRSDSFLDEVDEAGGGGCGEWGMELVVVLGPAEEEDVLVSTSARSSWKEVARPRRMAG